MPMSGRCAFSRVARSPGKTTMLFGRSALIMLAYIAAFADSVEAFGRGPASSFWAPCIW